MVSRASNGQNCCPDGAWGELLRKDGDPMYEDKGVIEKGTKCLTIVVADYLYYLSFSVSVSRQTVTVGDDQSGQTSSEEDVLDGESRDHSHHMSNMKF